MYVPSSSKDTADSFRLDENGNIFELFIIICAPKWSCNAIAVWLLSFNAKFMLEIISRTVYFPPYFNSITSQTFIVPFVIVPVLSRHNVSTRASISIQYNSCTRVRDFAKLITPTARASDVKRNMPAGIIPTIAPIVFAIVISRARSSALNN